MPPFLYPAFKLQHAMQKKFFGQKYWENKKIMHHEARILVKKLRDSGNDPNLVEPKFGDDNLQAGQARSARDRSKTQSGFKKKKPALTDAESLKKGFTDLRNKYFTVGEDKQESKEGKKGSDDAGGKLRRGEFHKWTQVQQWSLFNMFGDGNPVLYIMRENVLGNKENK